ncbi:MAG: sulfotransferase [Pseudomonadota bacterium]
MTWFLTALLCVILVEIGMRLPFGASLSTLTRSTGRAMKTVRAAGVSDHWKEKAMGAYAGRTFAATGKLALWLVILFGSAFLLAWAFGILDFLLGWVGILFTLFFATAYATFRLKAGGGAASGYGAMDKLLHRLALGAPSVAEMAFDIETGRLPEGTAEAAAGARHVFVAGLARAGTTVLMRRLYASGHFRSLTYRDMPFVLAPGLWSRLARQGARKAVAGERAHGDDLSVDVDSPEALEEPFWRLFAGDYIAPDHLRPHAPDGETVEKFRLYIAAILAASDGKTRYLSKNNNNILRLPTIAAACPEALILVPYRDPLDHAASLLRQHGNFIDQQAGDPFVASYMGWLAHHEFGGDHRPFRMDGSGGNDPANGDPGTLNYWLALWCHVYEALLENAPKSVHFVGYEALCTDPAVWVGIAEAAGIPPEAGAEMAFTQSPRKASAEGVDPALLVRARGVFDRLAAA